MNLATSTYLHTSLLTCMLAHLLSHIPAYIVRRREIHFFNIWKRRAQIIVRKYLHEHQKRTKIQIHIRSVSKIALFTVHIQDKAGGKNFFKVCLVGTLNMCLMEPNKMQKTKDKSDYSRLRKLQKLPIYCKIRIWQILPVFGHFLCLGWSDWFLVFCIFSSSLRHKFRVPTRHNLK